jgi:hypothetical protein
MKALFVVAVLALISGSAVAEDDYSSGYYAGQQTPNDYVPPNVSNEYYAGYNNAVDDSRREEQAKQEQQNYQPEPEPMPTPAQPTYGQD